MTPYDLLIVSVALCFGLVTAGIGWAYSASYKSRVLSVVAGMAFLGLVSLLATTNVILIELLVVAGLIAVWGLRYLTLRSIQILRNRPKVTGLVFSMVGIAILLTGHQAYDSLLGQHDLSKWELLLTLVLETPELTPIDAVWQTDRGSLLSIQQPKSPRESDQLERMENDMLVGFQWENGLIHRRPANDQFNCHGWVFANGQGWVMGSDVPLILKDNGYRIVTQPQVGDLAIYRGDDKSYRHSAIVRSIGTVTMVEGKWGWMGVYLHEVNRSCYGTKFEFYRTDRDGHYCLCRSMTDTPPVNDGAE